MNVWIDLGFSFSLSLSLSLFLLRRRRCRRCRCRESSLKFRGEKKKTYIVQESLDRTSKLILCRCNALIIDGGKTNLIREIFQITEEEDDDNDEEDQNFLTVNHSLQLQHMSESMEMFCDY